MRYIENNDQLGIMAADSSVANMIMENLGYDTAEQEAPSVIAIDDSLFGLDSEICSLSEGVLAIKLIELSDSLYESFDGNPELTESVEFDGEMFIFEDVVTDDEGNAYVTLDFADAEETPEDNEAFVMEFNGVEYDVVGEDEGDSFAYLVEGEDGEYHIVDEEAEADFVVNLKAVEQEA